MAAQASNALHMLFVKGCVVRHISSHFVCVLIFGNSATFFKISEMYAKQKFFPHTHPFSHCTAFTFIPILCIHFFWSIFVHRAQQKQVRLFPLKEIPDARQLAARQLANMTTRGYQYCSGQIAVHKNVLIFFKFPLFS